MECNTNEKNRDSFKSDYEKDESNIWDEEEDCFDSDSEIEEDWGCKSSI